MAASRRSRTCPPSRRSETSSWSRSAIPATPSSALSPGATTYRLQVLTPRRCGTSQQEAGFKVDRERYLLTTHGAHIYDTVRYLLGDVESIQARHRAYDRDHTWSVLVTLASGAVGTVTISVDVPGLPAEGIEIFGSAGSVHVDTPFPFYRQASNVRAYADGQEIVPVLTDGSAYERQLEAFARAIREDLAPTPDVHDGQAAVRLIEATATSVETGQEVRL